MNYDTEKINTALHDFYNATGITIDLLKTDLSIEDISQKVGFASTSYFSKTIKKIQKISPLKYRKSNAGL
ncbi:MAG: AraC family transcriptional regulator [Clostridia bacterium]|nr:AraC family transcriptional regulator [Clostridia bacterium]